MEHWLKHETRTLTMPDGTTRPHTAFKLVWDTADALVEEAGYTHDELVQWALDEVELQSADFDQAFTGVIKYLDDERRREAGLISKK